MLLAVPKCVNDLASLLFRLHLDGMPPETTETTHARKAPRAWRPTDEPATVACVTAAPPAGEKYFGGVRGLLMFFLCISTSV